MHLSIFDPGRQNQDILLGDHQRRNFIVPKGYYDSVHVACNRNRLIDPTLVNRFATGQIPRRPNSVHSRVVIDHVQFARDLDQPGQTVKAASQVRSLHQPWALPRKGPAVKLSPRTAIRIGASAPRDAHSSVDLEEGLWTCAASTLM